MFYLSLGSPVIQALWWWDIPMHILGGMWAGLIGAWFVVIAKKNPTLFECIVFALYCGVAVEILEFTAGYGESLFMHPALDVAKDFIMDAIGGFLAYRAVTLSTSV